mmetsp:Transcript_16/g.44  ORF Transcript_16/g.44 Transcript_16/m.44 type:complete len:165 (-) Transcript_16:252-746(-)
MPKTHMGWAKRTIEKEKNDQERKKQGDEQKLQLQAQQNLQMQLQQVVGKALGMALKPALAAAVDREKSEARSSRFPSGPNLPRTRPDAELHLGTVAEWRGHFGWIKPETPIDHPLANKHGGRVYVSEKDIISEGYRELRPGQTCQFVLYQDASGIGAEQCQVLT